MDRDRGGIYALLDLIEDEGRRGFLEYDFRSRFAISVDSLPDAMGYDEAARLVRILKADTSSAVAAHDEGWDFPISREALAIYDLFDLTVMASRDPKKPAPKPHQGRPFKSTGSRERHGDASGLNPEDVRARLDKAAGRTDGPV